MYMNFSSQVVLRVATREQLRRQKTISMDFVLQSLLVSLASGYRLVSFNWRSVVISNITETYEYLFTSGNQYRIVAALFLAMKGAEFVEVFPLAGTGINKTIGETGWSERVPVEIGEPSPMYVSWQDFVCFTALVASCSVKASAVASLKESVVGITAARISELLCQAIAQNRRAVLVCM